MRLSAGKAPEVLVNLRLLSKKQLSKPFRSTQLKNGSTQNPTFNETFFLEVKDAANSQLEVTPWDRVAQEPSLFLGEVLLNVGKLEPYAGVEIPQSFPIKKGSSVPVNCEITGTLNLVLQYHSELSVQKACKGFTLHLEKSWDEVKSMKQTYEADVSGQIVRILGSEPPRLEFVGTERWRQAKDSPDSRLDASAGTSVHANILPPLPGCTDLRSVQDLQALLQGMVDNTSSVLYSCPQFRGVKKIEWHAPFRKLAPAQSPTKHQVSKPAGTTGETNTMEQGKLLLPSKLSPPGGTTTAAPVPWDGRPIDPGLDPLRHKMTDESSM